MIDIKRLFMVSFLLFISIRGSTQESTVPLKFDNTFTLKFLIKYNFLIFSQSSWDYDFQTNRPLDFGIGFGYKDFSFDFSINIPFLYNQDYPKSKSIDFSFSQFYQNSGYFDGYIKYYSGFFNDAGYEIDLTILGMGISGEYILNKNHSIRSVYNLDRKQLVSNGSFLIGGGLFFSSINSDDAFLSDYSDKKDTFYFGPNIGYSYIWAFQNNFFINLLFTLGINCLIKNGNVSLGLQTLPKFSFGYHGKTWSVNIYSNTYLSSEFITKNEYNLLAPETIGIVFLKRF